MSPRGFLASSRGQQRHAVDEIEVLPGAECHLKIYAVLAKNIMEKAVNKDSDDLSL